MKARSLFSMALALSGGFAAMDGRPWDVRDPRIPQAPESAQAARTAAERKRARKAAARLGGVQ